MKKLMASALAAAMVSQPRRLWRFWFFHRHFRSCEL